MPTAPAVTAIARRPVAPGPCPAPSRCRQPPRRFLPCTGTSFCPKASREGGGKQPVPATRLAPRMGSVSCTKTETKPNAGDSLPFFARRRSRHRCHSRQSLGEGPKRDDPLPSPLSYFVELFRNKALARGGCAEPREKERG